MTAEFYLIHGLPDEVKPEAAGTEVVEVASAEFCGVDRLAGVAKDDFDAAAGILACGSETGADDLDGAADLAFVGVAQNIREGFIDSANYGARLLRGELQHFGGTFDGAADDAKGFGVAFKLEAHEEVGREFYRRFGRARGAFGSYSYLSCAHNHTIRENQEPLKYSE